MELQLIDWLAGRARQFAGVRLGIGDDAAVLAPVAEEQLVAIDLLAEGVHFTLAEHGARRVGRKALAVNLSDIAAMGGRPTAAFVSVLLPRAAGEEVFHELFAGMAPLAEQFEVTIAGGDTCVWSGGLVIDLCVVGRAHRRGPLVRSGARPGDVLLVTGPLGGSLAGKHLDFEPRIEEINRLLDRAELHAGIDLSDGLALDLSRLCRASACGAVLEAAAIPISAAVLQAAAPPPGGKTRELAPLDRALGDGEDFELLLAAAPSVADQLLADLSHGVPLTPIGRVTAEPGLWLEQPDGARAPLPAAGYEHA